MIPRFLSLFLLALLASSVHGQNADAAFDKLAEEYVSGYLAVRPLEAVSLGFHEYDGKVWDHTRASIDAEIARLKRFDESFRKIDQSKLSPRAAIDLRLLQAAIKNQLFALVEMATFDRNPMAYLNAIDVNVYLKRNFAPLEDRVRSIIAVENQIPKLIASAKTNLRPALPRPFVELGIEVTKGAVDFLQKNLMVALNDLKDAKLRTAVEDSQPWRRCCTARLSDLVNEGKTAEIGSGIRYWPRKISALPRRDRAG